MYLSATYKTQQNTDSQYMLTWCRESNDPHHSRWPLKSNKHFSAQTNRKVGNVSRTTFSINKYKHLSKQKVLVANTTLSEAVFQWLTTLSDTTNLPFKASLATTAGCLRIISTPNNVADFDPATLSSTPLIGFNAVQLTHHHCLPITAPYINTSRTLFAEYKLHI